jgi:hypothetical protein
MIPGAKRAHLSPLALLGTVGNAFGLRAGHAPLFFDAFEAGAGIRAAPGGGEGAEGAISPKLLKI